MSEQTKPEETSVPAAEGSLRLAPAKGGAGKEAEPARSLGEDLAAIRARVFGRREDSAAGDALTADENQEVYVELQECHQVDLNDEEHMAAVEDPALFAHMEAGRRRLAEHERSLARLPALEQLRTRYLRLMGGLSHLIRSLEKQHMDERGEVEVAHRQGRIISALLRGESPHGFVALSETARADKGVRASMGQMAQKAQEVAGAFDAAVKGLKAVHHSLFVLRRDIESVGDGLIALVEASQEDRRLQREYLAMAAAGAGRAAIRNSAAPRSTLGERLLASPALPENSGLAGAVRPLAD